MYFIFNYGIRNLSGKFIRMEHCLIEGETIEECLFNFVQYEQITIEKSDSTSNYIMNLYATNGYIYEVVFYKRINLIEEMK